MPLYPEGKKGVGKPSLVKDFEKERVYDQGKEVEYGV